MFSLMTDNGDGSVVLVQLQTQEKLNKIIINTQLPFCCARDKDSTTIRLLSIRNNGRDHDSACGRSCAFST